MIARLTSRLRGRVLHQRFLHSDRVLEEAKTHFKSLPDPSGGVQLQVTIPEGFHGSIYALVSDAAGNQSLSPAADPQNVGLSNITVDTSAPTLAINKPTANEVLNADDDTDAGTAGLQYSARFVVGGASELAVQVDGDPDDDSPVAGADGTVDVALSIAGAQGAQHTIEATASDAAGNSTSSSVTITAAPDRPAIAISSPAAARSLRSPLSRDLPSMGSPLGGLGSPLAPASRTFALSGLYRLAGT